MGKSWPSRICLIWNTAQYWGTLCSLTRLHTCVHSNMDKKNCSIFSLKSQSIFISISLCSQWKWSIIISTKLPEEWQTLVLGSRNTSITLNCQRIQCWDYMKCTTQNDTTSARCGEIHTRAICCFAYLPSPVYLSLLSFSANGPVLNFFSRKFSSIFC